MRIIESNLSINNKSIILEKVQTLDNTLPMSGEFYKIKSWIDSINKINFDNYIKIPESVSSSKEEITKYLNNTKNTLDNVIYGHTNAKRQILQIIAQTISNSNEGGTVLGIKGPPGVGKTQLVQDGISKVLNRPFQFISLGGASESSYLDGFDYTYEGSKYGKIVECLINAKCMNPVIFFDELDKVSSTEKGEEIISILTHITDSTQNHHFNDKYFHGIDIDLSKIVFIFSFNDDSNISRILKDRMYIIKTDCYDNKDKLNISNKYLIPKILNSTGFNENDIKFKNEIIDHIIEKYTYEGGVRKLKENINEICKEINLRKLTDEKILNKKIKFPVILTKEMIDKDILRKKKCIKIDKISSIDKIGLINGLWANDLGIGGLLQIEAYFIPTTNKLDLELTGLQGEVMKESMKCAKTVAWNYLSDDYKDLFNTKSKECNYGIHIHCPDGATPKDGPSAGAAITILIISLLTNKIINNKVAITGEINLNGEITEIGGLKEKLNGAKKAGVEHVLISKDNESDYIKIINENNIISDKFKVTIVENIHDAINYFIDI